MTIPPVLSRLNQYPVKLYLVRFNEDFPRLLRPNHVG